MYYCIWYIIHDCPQLQQVYRHNINLAHSLHGTLENDRVDHVSSFQNWRLSCTRKSRKYFTMNLGNALHWIDCDSSWTTNLSHSSSIIKIKEILHFTKSKLSFIMPPLFFFFLLKGYLALEREKKSWKLIWNIMYSYFSFFPILQNQSFFWFFL